MALADPTEDPQWPPASWTAVDPQQIAMNPFNSQNTNVPISQPVPVVDPITAATQAAANAVINPPRSEREKDEQREVDRSLPGAYHGPSGSHGDPIVASRIGVSGTPTGDEIAQPTLPPPDSGVPAPDNALIDPNALPPPSIDAQQLAMYGAPAGGPPPPPGAPADMQQAMYGVPAPAGAPGAVPVGGDFSAALANAGGEPGRIEGTPQEESDRSVDKDAQRLALDPYELAKQNEIAAASKRSDMVAQALKASLDNQKREQANYDAHQAAIAKTKQDSDRVLADAQTLANTKIDPDQHLGIGQSILNVVALTLGGAMSQGTGGRNLALEQLNKAIETHIETQKANLANRWKGLGLRQEGIATDAAREADGYRDQETFRIATYQRAMNDLQTKMQDFDPRGTTVRELAGQYQQIAGAQGQAIRTFQQKQFDNNLKETGAVQKQQEIDEVHRQHDLEYEEKSWKKKGAGVGLGGAGNTSYNVPTGIMSPYKDENGKPVVVMGTKSLDVKGHEKEFSAAQAQVNTYGHVQDYWNNLTRLGEQLDGAKKTMSESAYSKFKSTKAAEFDANRHALVVYLTKELGDKLTQGQIDEQAQRIPERASLFESRDPMKQISDAKEAADQDFDRDMNVLGVDATPIIAAARRTRAAAPIPDPESAVTAAQQAVAGARTPSERKDAATQLEVAKDMMRGQKEQEAHAQQDIADAATVRPHHDALPTTGLPADFAAEVADRNAAAQRLDLEAKAFKDAQAKAPKPGKLKGDNDKAAKDHEQLVGQHATRVAQSHHALQKAEDDLADSLAHALSRPDFGGLPSDKIAAVAKRFGEDPSKFGEPVANGPFGGSHLEVGNQIARGGFAAKLHNLSTYKKRLLIKSFFGGE